MLRRSLVLVLFLCLSLLPGVASAAPPHFEPGSRGLGDEYFPDDGNGGYDVRHYDLELAYDPATDRLTGQATIRITATQDLSSFNLDFDDLAVRSVRINGTLAGWTHEDGELTVVPSRGIREHRVVTVTIAYDGVPQTLPDTSGFIHTDDGALAVGQPHGASTWYPANDHPSDRASYQVRLTVPSGLEAISNGVLQRRQSGQGTTTWTWVAREPMASYLAMLAIGEFDVQAYREDGIRFWDAVDPRLFARAEPRTGDQYVLSQAADLAYKRLARTVSVPDSGGQLSFWVNRDTEPTWDFFFVEAHAVGSDEWTTLPDLNGHTSPDPGNVCPYWLDLHPFLARYQTATPEGCDSEGSTGQWHAASGASYGYEQWTVDLAPWAGQDVEIALSYASDDIVAFPGVFVDDITGPGGQGSTSFEADADPLDGWAVLGPPEGSAPNVNDWRTGTAEDAPPAVGETIRGSLARQPEIIEFLSDVFGPYPFSASGGIVDVADISFALETQTRPIYSTGFFSSAERGDAVVVHELAHQWAGDHLTVERWRDIWLNEGFATYTEWLWSESEGRETAQEIYDSYTTAIPADSPFWEVVIGHPGSAEELFDIAVYDRGAMTLHALRLQIGDEAFFELLRTWFREQGGGTVTTEEFVTTAERVSGQQLDDLFTTWLFTPEKPAVLSPGVLSPAALPPAVSARSTASALLPVGAPTSVAWGSRRR